MSSNLVENVQCYVAVFKTFSVQKMSCNVMECTLDRTDRTKHKKVFIFGPHGPGPNGLVTSKLAPCGQTLN